MRKPTTSIAVVFVALLTVLFGLQVSSQPLSADELNDDEAVEIAVEAYFYAYPLVIMDVTRQAGTNCETANGAKMCAPMNQFGHVPAFPDATFTDVVRPNFRLSSLSPFSCSLLRGLGDEGAYLAVRGSCGNIWLIKQTHDLLERRSDPVTTALIGDERNLEMQCPVEGRPVSFPVCVDEPGLVGDL